ncbi:immunity 49 family protein [bacterium]|nr:immunity 49 family protein [bacterium]
MPFERDVFKGLVTGDAFGYLAAMEELLYWHTKQASRKKCRNLESFLCLSGLGYCKLALKVGLITMDDIAGDSAVLPKGLLLLPEHD